MIRNLYLLGVLGGICAAEGASGKLAAQTMDCPVEPTGQGAYLPCQLDVAPAPMLDTIGLMDMEYSACSGAEFHLIVSRDGAVSDVAVSSLRAGARLCERFARAWRFSPGRRRGRNVDVRLTTVLDYDMPSQEDLIWDPVIEWRDRGDDFLLKLEWSPPSGDVRLPMPALDSAYAAVVQAVAAHGKVDDLDHYCVDAGESSDRTGRVVEIVGELDLPVFERSDCPSIHRSADGRVTYREDPPYLHVGIRGEPRPANTEGVVVDAWYARGMGGAGFRCRADRTPLMWRAWCITVWSS